MTLAEPAKRGVILLGGTGSALSAARSLHEWGVPVIVLGNRSDTVRVSRSCSAFIDLGKGDGVQQRWLSWLSERAGQGEVILACSDDGLELLAKHRKELVMAGYRPGESRDDVLTTMLDKEKTYELARRHGIPCPVTVPIRTDEDIDVALATVPFPCAVKPLQSHLFARHFSNKLLVAQDAASLRDHLQVVRSLGLDVLVTEIIPGTDDSFVSYYSYLDESGAPLFHFTKRKIRGYPVHFGLWCYQITEWDKAAAELGLRFFQSAGLLGVGNVEFKKDARDGTLKLIECNHRFTAANELVRRSGVDVVRLAYARAIGVDYRIAGFREGMRMWHPVEDLAAMVAYRRHGELTVHAWLASLMHRQIFPSFRISDPLPSLTSWLTIPRRFLSWSSAPRSSTVARPVESQSAQPV